MMTLPSGHTCSGVSLSAAAIANHCLGAISASKVAAMATKLRRSGVEIGWREDPHSVWWYTKDEARCLAEALGVVIGWYRQGEWVPEAR